jgi:hypothetical protein
MLKTNTLDQHNLHLQNNQIHQGQEVTCNKCGQPKWCDTCWNHIQKLLNRIEEYEPETNSSMPEMRTATVRSEPMHQALRPQAQGERLPTSPEANQLPFMPDKNPR